MSADAIHMPDWIYELVETFVALKDRVTLVEALALLLASSIMVPFVVLVHEVGHALAALALRRRVTELAVGDDAPVLTLRVRGFRLRIGAITGRGDAAGFILYDGSWAGRRETLAIALAGPLASLAGARPRRARHRPPWAESALRTTQARGRLVRALADDPPPGTAVMLLDRDGEIELSSPHARRWLAEHFGTAEHPGWLPRPVAEWLALPPRPPLVSQRDGRRLTVCLLPGDPRALLLEETGASLRPGALARLGLTPRESEVLRAATVIEGEAELAWKLFLSLHALRERLARLEAKLEVRTAGDAVARALRESL